MTDQELQQLAREIAENKIPRSAIKDKFQWETLVYAKEKGYKEVIEAILRTHCIVSREEVKALGGVTFVTTLCMLTTKRIGKRQRTMFLM